MVRVPTTEQPSAIYGPKQGEVPETERCSSLDQDISTGEGERTQQPYTPLFLQTTRIAHQEVHQHTPRKVASPKARPTTVLTDV